MPAANQILYVDDDARARKWFERAYQGEFEIRCASSGEEALGILAASGAAVAVVVSDYRMPDMDGLQLLLRLQLEHRRLVRLLVTAYAEKDLAIAAVNQAHVLQILEKPLEETSTREALREALALYKQQAMERALNEGRVSALRETLGFLAHELNTPLAAIRGIVAGLADRLVVDPIDQSPLLGKIEQSRPGELREALTRAERQALYCQSLVSSFVRSARDAYPGVPPQPACAATLLKSLSDEYPFDQSERLWVSTELHQNFRMAGRRDLLYLVLCTITKNALQVLTTHPAPRLRIEAGVRQIPGHQLRGYIRMIDNGRGIDADLLARLTKEPVPSAGSSTGMGLLFCQRVMQEAGGHVEVQSSPPEGTCVTLWFDRDVAVEG